MREHERQVLVGQPIPKNSLQDIRVHLVPDWAGGFDVDIRVYEQRDGEGTEHPTTAGFRIEPDTVRELVKKLGEIRHYRRQGDRVILVEH